MSREEGVIQVDSGKERLIRVENREQGVIHVDSGEEGVVFSTLGSKSRFLVIWKSRFWGLCVVGSKNMFGVGLREKWDRRNWRY